MCCALQTLVQICLFNIFCAKKQKKALDQRSGVFWVGAVRLYLITNYLPRCSYHFLYFDQHLECATPKHRSNYKIVQFSYFPTFCIWNVEGLYLVDKLLHWETTIGQSDPARNVKIPSNYFTFWHTAPQHSHRMDVNPPPPKISLHYCLPYYFRSFIWLWTCNMALEYYFQMTIILGNNYP